MRHVSGAQATAMSDSHGKMSIRATFLALQKRRGLLTVGYLHVAVIEGRPLDGRVGSRGDVHDCGVAEAICLDYARTASGFSYINNRDGDVEMLLIIMGLVSNWPGLCVKKCTDPWVS